MPTATVDDILWLEKVLFAQSGELNAMSFARSPIRTDIAWATMPVRGTTRRLVPATGRFAATAFGNHHDAMSTSRRLAGRLAQTAVRSGVLRLTPRLRADSNTVLADPQRSVIAAAAAAIGTPIVSCAITLGPHRYNRKPVVQLMDRNAATIGFLKVGADAVTSTMVATEADAIARLRRPTSPPLEVPSVLWRSEWHGRSVACFSPVVVANNALVPANPARLAAVAAAVIEAGGGEQPRELRGCAAVRALRSEAELSQRTDVLDLLERTETTLGEDIISLGLWHGDFSPWNMISTHATTALIDWEFAGEEMPVGSDLLHNRVMVATHLHGEPATDVFHRLLAFDNSIPELHAMGVPAKQHRPHMLLYLLELIRRDIELQRVGRPITGFGDAAKTAADRILAEASRQ